MIIRFIDINTGNVFDGSKPYTHWFDGKQSLGLNYDKQFIVLTDANDLCVSLNSEVFYLVDDHKIGYYTDNNGNSITQTINDKTYLDLDVLKTNYLYHIDECAVVGDYKIFAFNIIAQGKYVGEITDTFSINGQEFQIGADFVDENESLSTNLLNFGVEISAEVQRAIYEKQIDEQKTDYVLLNRKFKELLNEYINIVANKGSYKSLINSLNWFEYGDIVKLYEYWKHSEPNKNYLSKRDITQYINQETENLLYTKSKTTYTGISAALNKIKTSDGEICFENNYDEVQSTDYKLVDEPNPLLEDVSMLWSKNDMSLKMTLLGNFFATYFLPIHLDLIHSTIENIVYSNTLKITSLSKLERIDILDSIYQFRCDTEDVYHLENVECWSNPYIPFGMTVDPDDETKILDMIGVTDHVGVGLPFLVQHFKGIGTIIPLSCKLYNVNSSSTITDGIIYIYKDGELILSRTTTNIEHIPTDEQIEINFNILLKEIGTYQIQLEFRRSDGIKYIKVLSFEIDGQTEQTIALYKLVPRFDSNGMNTTVVDDKRITGKFDIAHWIQDEDSDSSSVIPIQNIADYVLNPVQYTLKYYNQDEPTVEKALMYSQFISATKENIYNTVHTNQVIIVQLKKELAKDDITIYSSRGQNYDLFDIVSEINASEPKSGISKVLPGFVWFSMERACNFVQPTSDDVISEWTSDKTIFWIGINTKPTTYDSVKYIVKNKAGKKIKVWNREKFVPYFYKLEKYGEVSVIDKIVGNLTDEQIFKLRTDESTYIINNTDVVCFLPELRCIRRPYKFNWKFTCASTDDEITPLQFRNYDVELSIDEDGNIEKILPNDSKNTDKDDFPVILQPLFGRYDFRILPDSGYYDITLNYKLDDNQEDNVEKTICSSFIVKKSESTESESTNTTSYSGSSGTSGSTFTFTSGQLGVLSGVIGMQVPNATIFSGTVGGIGVSIEL